MISPFSTCPVLVSIGASHMRPGVDCGVNPRFKWGAPGSQAGRMAHTLTEVPASVGPWTRGTSVTTTNTSDQQTQRLPRVAGWVAFALALIVASQGFFILLNGLDQSRFEEKAGVEWVELEQAFPTVTDYLGAGQTDRTLAITTIAIGLQTSLLIWFAMRRGSRVPAPVFWVFSGMLLAWSVHFLVNDDLAIGAPNLVFGVLAALAVFIARPELTGSSR